MGGGKIVSCSTNLEDEESSGNVYLLGTLGDAGFQVPPTQASDEYYSFVFTVYNQHYSGVIYESSSDGIATTTSKVFLYTVMMLHNGTSINIVGRPKLTSSIMVNPPSEASQEKIAYMSRVGGDENLWTEYTMAGTIPSGWTGTLKPQVYRAN